jgi:glycosyltransferase involved in cell wall biosynthesis
MNYAIITPAKNEEQYIRFTLESMLMQTYKPTRWVIIDDNSMDRTTDIVKEYAKKYPWIFLMRSNQIEKERRGGSKVVNLFYQAYESLNDLEFEIVAKIDADLTLPKDYFEKVINAIQVDEKIGLCGGYCVIEKKGIYVEEKTAEFHVRGPLKVYRKAALEDIGGLISFYNWDGLDQYYLMYKGWKIQPLRIAVIHHRPTSTLINRGFLNSFKIGGYYYQQGHNVLLAIPQAIIFATRTHPLILSGLYFLMGYMVYLILRKEIVVPKDVKIFINKFQLKRLRKVFYI